MQQTARQELLAGAEPPRAAELRAEAQGQRERLLAQTDSLHKTSDTIRRAQGMLHETTEIGVTIMSDLQGQTQQLERTHDMVSDIETSLDRSRRLLADMARRAMANKLIMVFIIVVLVAFIVLIVYLNWFVGGGSSSGGSEGGGSGSG